MTIAAAAAAALLSHAPIPADAEAPIRATLVCIPVSAAAAHRRRICCDPAARLPTAQAPLAAS